MKKSKMSSQVYRLAAFPLNLILLPGEEIPLRIFEPRYKQLINESLEYSLPFGIPYIDSKNGITRIGSEVEIINMAGRNANEDMVINIKGKALFKTIDYFPTLPNKLYGGTVSEPLNIDFITNNPEIVVKVKKLKLNIGNELGTFVRGNGIDMLDIARTLMLKSEEKHKLLSLPNSAVREQFMVNQLNFVEMIRHQEAKLEHNFQLN